MNNTKFKTIYNKSFTYVLPMLGDLLKIKPSDVSACYIGDCKRPEFDSHILVLFQSEFLYKNKDVIAGHGLFVESYIGEGNKEIFVFKVPQAHKDNFQKYKDGMYSRLTGAYKVELLTFHNVAKNSSVFHVLTRNKALRNTLQKELNVNIKEDQELSSKPDLYFEYFSISHFTKPSKKMSVNAVKRVSNSGDNYTLSKVVGVNSDGTLIHLVNNKEIIGLKVTQKHIKNFDFNSIILFKTKSQKR